jgi:flagellar hook-length control protein FliK
MRGRRQCRPHRRATCAILHLQCCTHRVTDPASMPALATLSLLSTAVSGLANVAGQVADALHNAKSGSDKKADSPNQAQDANQLAAVFAAYLAAAAHTIPSPASTATASPNIPLKGQGQSAKDGAQSLLPLSVMLAAGPTTAIAAAIALRSPTVGSNTSALKTVQTPSLVKGAVATAPTVKQPAAPGTKMPSPSKGMQNLQAASVHEQMVSTTAKGAQDAQSGGRKPPETSLRGLTAPETSLRGLTPPALGTQETSAEIPVLALHDVPGPHVQDSSHSAISPTQSVETRITGGESSTHPPADTGHSPVEALLSPDVSLQGRTARSGPQTLFEAPVAHNSASPLPSYADEAATKPSFTDSASKQSVGTKNETPSPSPTLQPVIAAVSAGPPAGNTTSTASNNAQTNASIAEQLNQALITQASVVNHEGRANFHLRLEPPQLGSVQIHLTATDHNTVSARFIVAQEGTRQLIEGQAHQLRQSLAGSGVVLGSFDVTRDGNGFAQGGHDPPPEPPPPPANVPTQSVTTRVTQNTDMNVVQTIPTDGINVLA